MISCVLLTTCNLETEGTDDLRRLINSVSAAVDRDEVGTVRHFVLLQRCSEQARDEFQDQLPGFVDLLSDDQSMSPAAARNRLILHLHECGTFDRKVFVGFPDDDAWYPPGSLARIKSYFEQQDVAFLLCRYGPEAPGPEGDAFKPRLQTVLSRGACAGIFVRGELLLELGGFNPLLGIATMLSGGEDTEFSIRAYQAAAARTICVPAALVGHAASDPSKKARYYEGGLAAIMAHCRSTRGGRVALFRKLLVGVWWAASGKLKWQNLALAVRRAASLASRIRQRVDVPVLR